VVEKDEDGAEDDDADDWGHLNRDVGQRTPVVKGARGRGRGRDGARARGVDIASDEEGVGGSHIVVVCNEY
jgi:hypothetical protein